MDREIKKIEVVDIKFEYDSKNDLFQNAEEAKEYQSLFDKYKTSKEITDHFTKCAVEQRSKMEDMRKSGRPPGFSRIKSDREDEKFNLLKEIKVILEKKKKDTVTSFALTEEVKCGGGDRPSEKESRRDQDDEDRPKMAEGKGRKQMPGAGRSGRENYSVADFSAQMSGQMGDRK